MDITSINRFGFRPSNISIIYTSPFIISIFVNVSQSQRKRHQRVSVSLAVFNCPVKRQRIGVQWINTMWCALSSSKKPPVAGSLS